MVNIAEELQTERPVAGVLSSGVGRFISVRTGIPHAASERLLRGVTWNTVGCVLGQGASFASTVVLARFLGRESFGHFAMVQTTVAGFSTIAGLGIGATATKYVSQYRTTDTEKAGRILGLSALVAFAAATVFSTVLLVLAPWLAIGGGGAPELTSAIRLSTIYVFFITLNGYQMGALSGLEAFRSMAAINVASGLATLGFTVAMSLWLGIRGAILAQGFSAMLAWLLYHFALRAEGRARNIVISCRGALQQRAILSNFSLPTSASSMIACVAIWWCNADLVRIHGYGELAVFSAVNNMRLMVVFMPLIIGRVTLPLLNNMFAGGDLAGYRRTFWGAAALNTGIAVLSAVALALAGRHILRFFGKAFTAPLALIVILLGATVIEVAACNLYQAMFSGHTLWGQVLVLGIWMMVLMVSLRWTVERYGATGLALSYLAAWSSSAVLYGAVALKRQRSWSQIPFQEYEVQPCSR